MKAGPIWEDLCASVSPLVVEGNVLGVGEDVEDEVGEFDGVASERLGLEREDEVV